MNRETELNNLLGVNGKAAQEEGLNILISEAEMENSPYEEIQEFRDKCLAALTEGEKLFRYLTRLSDEKYLAENRCSE